jgi:hypothetical protein
MQSVGATAISGFRLEVRTTAEKVTEVIEYAGIALHTAVPPSVFVLRIDMRIWAEPGLRGAGGGVVWDMTGGVSCRLLPW